MSTPDPACCPPRRYRGVSLEQRQGDRRTRLIEAGLTVIGTQGYGAATVRAICAEAGPVSTNSPTIAPMIPYRLMIVSFL